MSEKMVFALASRYPTEKAYGVTVGRTAAAMRNSGQKVEIVSPDTGLREVDEFNNPVQGIKMNCLLRQVYKLGKKSRTGNTMWQIVFGSIIGWRYRYTDTSLCLREVFATLFSSIINNSSVHLLEIHHKPKGIKIYIIDWLSSRCNVRISFLSQDLAKRTKFTVDNRNVFVIPMSVPREFLVEEKVFPQKSEEIRICFAGKAKSNGEDNGLVQFVRDLTEIDSGVLYHLVFVGIQDKDVETKIEKLVACKSTLSLELRDQLFHGEVLQVLKQSDIGVIPYPNSKYNRDRFPIKALEFAATRNLILAADTEGNRAVIPLNCCLFYKPGNPASLRLQLLTCKDTEKVSNMLDNAFKWAQTNTYEDRANLYLKALQKINY